MNKETMYDAPNQTTEFGVKLFFDSLLGGSYSPVLPDLLLTVSLYVSLLSLTNMVTNWHSQCKNRQIIFTLHFRATNLSPHKATKSNVNLTGAENMPWLRPCSRNLEIRCSEML